jgi:DNA-3-methyladenine glycosylase II
MKKQVKFTGPFDLRNQNDFFGGWPVLRDTSEEFAIVITFPVEGWQESAAVVISQKDDTSLYAETDTSEKAMNQALACLSIDVDADDWEKIGKQDPVIANLQEKYDYLRPVLFHSPYEAAAGFIIGQRVSIKQRQAIQKKMAEQLGETFEIDGQKFSAFPTPQVLLDLKDFPGLNDKKLDRLHGVAQAAIDGELDRSHLLKVPVDEALNSLQELPGIGPFYASGILYRGAGIINDLTDDDLTKFAIQQVYNLPTQPTQEEVLKIAENWRPYRMWCEVLIHIWLRREVGLPKRR